VVRLLFLACGLILLAYLVARLGVGLILDMLLSLRWSILPVFLLYAGHQAARAWALTHCVPKRGVLRYLDALTIRLSGEAVQFLTFSGPILSEPTKAWLLRQRGFSTWEGLAITLTEFLASSMAAAAMAIAGLGYVLAAIHPTGPVRVAAIAILLSMSVFVVLFVVGIGARLHLIGALVRGVARLPLVRDRVQGRIDGLPIAEDLLIETLRDSPARLARIMTIEALGQIFLGIELFVLLAALGEAPGVANVMAIEGSTKFITAGYFFVPGQVGVSEGTYAVIFAVFGLSAAAGFAVSFVRRIRSIVTAGIGFAALSFLTSLGRPSGNSVGSDRGVG